MRDDEFNGIVFHGPCFSLADFADACSDHGEETGYCEEQWQGYFCSRSRGHLGPCATSVDWNEISAVWELLS